MSDEENTVIPPDAPAPEPLSVESLPPAEELVAELPPVDQPAAGLPPVFELPPAPAPTSSAVSDDDRLMAALTWVAMVVVQAPLLSLVFLLIEPNRSRPFQRHHSVVSILFWVAAIVYEVLAAIAYTILGFLTLTCGFFCLWPILLVPHALALYYAFQAYSGKQVEIPVLSDFARNQGWA